MFEISKDFIIYINIGLIAFFGLNLFLCYKKGFIKTLLGVMRFLIAFVVAFILSGPLANVFPIINHESNSVTGIMFLLIKKSVNNVVWFAIVFVAVLLILWLLTRVLEFSMRVAFLGTFNHILGLLLGFVICFIQANIILLILYSPIFKNGDLIAEKSILSYVNQGVSYIEKFADFSDIKRDLINNRNVNNPDYLKQTLEQFGLSEEQITKVLKEKIHE